MVGTTVSRNGETKAHMPDFSCHIDIYLLAFPYKRDYTHTDIHIHAKHDVTQD